MQDVTTQEIAELTAKDFAVEIRGLPPHDNVREFKAALWLFIESITEKSPDELNPITQIIDSNNNLMNITFGLSDYGKMDFFMQIEDIY